MSDADVPLPGFEQPAPPRRRRRTTASRNTAASGNRSTRTGRDVSFHNIDLDATAAVFEPVRGAADVVVDGAPTRLGALSYVVPDDLTVRIGDAVEIPFGRRNAYGVVIGAGDQAAATRTIIQTFGTRTHPTEIAAAAKIAADHFVPTANLIARLAPRTGKGATPMDAGPVALVDPDRTRIPVAGETTARRRYIARAPGVSAARLAAEAAVELLELYDIEHPDRDGTGQVLVCCGSAAEAAATLAEFSSGAARVDAGADAPGSWSGFAAGTVRVAIGSRSSAWYAPKRLAGIVVAEEQHAGHVESRQPHTHTRDVAVARLAGRDIPLVFTGLCPSSAALGAGVKLCVAGTPADWPEIVLVDRSDCSPGHRAFPTPVRLAVAQTTRRGAKPVVVADRRNARRSCAKCRATRRCEQCDSARCDHDLGACARCGGTEVRLVGWDAERVVDFFDGSVRAVTWAELTKVRQSELLVVFDADAPARMPHLEPEYRAANQLLAALEAAGPSAKVMLTTSEPDSLLLGAIASHDLRSVARLVWANAKALQLPPFGRVVSVLAARETAPSTASLPGHVVGPRRVGDGEWELLVRCSDADLPAVGRCLDRMRRSAKLRVTVS